MIKSMTGYGSAKITDEGITVSVELKSVNNRYLETSVRLPRVYLALEEEIKNVIKQHISRGKVDVFISVDSSELDTVDVSVTTANPKGSSILVKIAVMLLPQFLPI